MPGGSDHRIPSVSASRLASVVSPQAVNARHARNWWARVPVASGSADEHASVHRALAVAASTTSARSRRRSRARGARDSPRAPSASPPSDGPWRSARDGRVRAREYRAPRTGSLRAQPQRGNYRAGDRCGLHARRRRRLAAAPDQERCSDDAGPHQCGAPRNGNIRLLTSVCAPTPSPIRGAIAAVKPPPPANSSE